MHTEKLKITYNVDQKEISKFEAIASRWWDLEGEFKLLHRINSLRLDYITKRSGGLFKKNVLDVGCGGGILTESIAREGASVTGLDMGFEQLQIARLHMVKSGVKINYIQETIEKHVITCLQQYDVITCMEILEHVPDPQSIINACAKLVKPGGQVFFSTINSNIESWLMIVLLAEYILHIIPKGTHDLKKFINPAKLLSWIDRTCLKEQHIIGIHYNPILDKFKLCSDVNINYMLHTTAKNI